MKLNPEQESAVKLTGQNLLVSAGAGTGKTRVLVERFVHYVVTGQALVSEILALTFTEKAAGEMKSRLMERFSALEMNTARRELESAAISTIHAFAARILREHPLEAGVDPQFRVLEADEADHLQQQALDLALETQCVRGTPVFELLRVYSEKTVCEALPEILKAARRFAHAGGMDCSGTALSRLCPEAAGSESKADGGAAASAPARHQGLTVKALLEKEIELPPRPGGLEALIGETDKPELAADWKRFESRKTWDWPAIQDYENWLAKFSAKRKAPWPVIKERAREFLLLALEGFVKPWRESLGQLAVAFEEAYETLKNERGLLDFDDLEIHALNLFKQEKALGQRLLEQYRRQFRQIMVDEFQDTSPLQLELVTLMAGADNLFFVGDYKQSIYGFRGAEPGLFLQKEKEYDGSTGLRLALTENYRTGSGLLDWINRFFAHLWEEDAFEFKPLKCSAGEAHACPVESIFIEAGKGETAKARMLEAGRIARRILGLREEGFSYGEMAILFEAMTDAPLYEYALKQAGIPYFAVSGRGFYQQPEIRDMISFLSFLENPLADIPLAACLRSPLFQISDSTLFWLARAAKAEDPAAPLFSGLEKLESTAEIEGVEKEKLIFFRRTAGELLEAKDRLRLTELLDLTLERTAFEMPVLAGPDGIRRLANLRKLIGLARRAEDLRPAALGDFLNQLRRLELEEARESEAQLEAEKSGRVVRLMTIHRAKGLEFPVVFVADMGRSDRHQGGGAIRAFSAGVALKVRNEASGEWETPYRLDALQEQFSLTEKQERKRLLYVAMTRAQKKLILCGVGEREIKEKEGYYDIPSWIQWVRRSPLGRETVEVDETTLPKAVPQRSKEITAAAFLEQMRAWDPSVSVDPKGAAVLEDSLRIRLLKRRSAPARTVDLPVSAFAVFARSQEDYRRVYELGFPDRMQDHNQAARETEVESQSPSDFGTAMHALLERIHFKNPAERLDEHLKACFAGRPAEALEAERLLKLFMQTELFERLRRARRVLRELPFILNERHGMVQGIIDVIFEETDGSWHILDYKTAVGSAEQVKSHEYGLQIQLYALAVERLLRKTPATGILYFLKNQWQYVEQFSAQQLAETVLGVQQMQEKILQLKNQVEPAEPASLIRRS